MFIDILACLTLKGPIEVEIKSGVIIVQKYNEMHIKT